jgi:hypothetical protein
MLDKLNPGAGHSTECVLTSTTAAAPAAATAPVRDVNGRKLSRRLKRELNPTHRALLAFELECGVLWLHHLSRRQAQRLTGANQRHVTSLRRASPDEREQVKKGLLPLSALRAPSDADVDRIVARIGAERLLKAFDRLTAPTLVAAE